MSTSVKNSKETIRSVVKRTQMFSQWPDRAIDKLLEDADLRRFSDGEHALHSGDASANLALVASGSFMNQRMLPTGDALIVEFLMPGQCTSFVAVFDGLPATYDVMARGEAEMIFVPRKSLLAALALDPACWNEIVLMLGRMLRLQYETALMRTHSLRCQIVKMLYWWARGEITPDSKRVRIPVGISQEELGAILGRSTPTISKEIGELIKKGVLARNYRQIEIVDLPALVQMIVAEDPDNATRMAPLLARSPGVFGVSD